jgi:hypothetical protein
LLSYCLLITVGLQNTTLSSFVLTSKVRKNYGRYRFNKFRTDCSFVLLILPIIRILRCRYPISFPQTYNNDGIQSGPQVTVLNWCADIILVELESIRLCKCKYVRLFLLLILLLLLLLLFRCFVLACLPS